MITYLLEEFGLRKLHHKQRKNDKWYDKAISEAHSSEERQQIHAEASSEHFFYKEQIDKIITNRLLRHAYKLLVETPTWSDETCWEECRGISGKVLTMKGIAQIRHAIREEQQARHNVWLPWLTGLTGVIGAFTGFVAVTMR